MASAVIPWIVGRSNQSALLAKARVDQALELIDTPSSVNVILNKMKAAFETFEKDSMRGIPDDYRKRRDELRQRIYALRNDLDGIAWWWAWSISYRSRVLKLISNDDFNRLTAMIHNYTDNLVQTSAVLDEPWRIYIPDDHPTPPAKPIMDGLAKRLSDLQGQREELVRQMSAIFQKQRCFGEY